MAIPDTYFHDHKADGSAGPRNRQEHAGQCGHLVSIGHVNI